MDLGVIPEPAPGKLPISNGLQKFPPSLSKRSRRRKVKMPVKTKADRIDQVMAHIGTLKKAVGHLATLKIKNLEAKSRNLLSKSGEEEEKILLARIDSGIHFILRELRTLEEEDKSPDPGQYFPSFPDFGKLSEGEG